MTTQPVMWADGNDLHLSITAPSGLVYQQTFAMAVLTAKAGSDDGEVIRFTYDLVDPEDGTTTRGAARILVQEIPDPRGKPFLWKCVDCGYEDTARSLICPNCATDGELAEETERQPSGAGATATLTKSNCMRRGDQHDPHTWDAHSHRYYCDGTAAPTRN